MALSTLTEWTGSAIISNLVDTVYSYLGEHMSPVNAETEAALSRLKTALPKITAVMSVAEVLKFNHPTSGVDAWLEQFRLAFQAAEDVLDELKYLELEGTVKKQDQVSELFSSTIGSLKRKFLDYIGYTINDDKLKCLMEAVKMLDRAASDVGCFLQFATALHAHDLLEPQHQPVNTSSQETTSFLTETEVLGRETEKAIIIEWLKNPTNHSHLSFYSIVGMGGVGKTTLAQLIFQQMIQDNHFEIAVWVCVSSIFSVENITKKILEEVGGKNQHSESLNSLQRNLKERIFSKKLFLILDDVWNDDKMSDWAKLIAPLKFARQGSKILLTTRMNSVADMLACVLNMKKEYLLLGGLEEKALLLLLNKYAFHGFNLNNHKDLQIIGNQIVKMLRGSPLAAKVIGNLLNSCMSFQYWKRILNCDSLINLEQAKDVVDVLKLSYYHLPADLQECFRFCCIFPNDFVFEKYMLIRMWMASGFIRKRSCKEERLEDIGEEYFNHLLRKSFFEYLRYKNGYIMHDLMHDLAKNVSKGECCRVESNDKLIIIPRTAQHVSVYEDEIGRIFDLSNLRTLVITTSQNKPFVDLTKFVLPYGSLKKTLRLLVIHGYRSCELSEEIGCLIHLRFLSVKLINVRKQSFRYLLPHSIWKLHHLQVLEMNEGTFSPDYSGIQTTGITSLVNLRYMSLPHQMMQNINEVHKLTSLQELIFFVGSVKGCHVDEIKTLNHLRRLSIQQMENVQDPVEAMNAELSKKESLISLSLNWTEGTSANNTEQIIDNLQPHPNLKELKIKYWKGYRSPIWMRDAPSLDLSSITLSNCPVWKDLPLFGKMPYLKALSLGQMNEVQEMDYSFESTRTACAFSSLEQIYCSQMPKWVSWTGPHSCYGLPKLKELTISNCPALVQLPAMPISLKNFKLCNVGLHSLPNIYHGSNTITSAASFLKSSLRSVVIIGCPNLQSLNGFMQQENLGLQAIEELTIKDCENLLHLPTEGFKKLMSLKYLTVENSPKLVVMDINNKILPEKLKELAVENCGELDKPLIEESLGLTALTQLRLSGSANVTSLITTRNAFTSLEYLEIRKCDKLVKISAQEVEHRVDGENNLTLLQLHTLHIGNCQNLTNLPNLPYSLTEFSINNTAVNDLPEVYLSSDSTGSITSSLKSSLRQAEIINCPNLKSLNGFLQQDNIDLQALEKLKIINCENLIQLPIGAFGKFVSLQHLAIKGSPKLVATDNQSILLPIELMSLSMGNCGELDVPLLNSTSGLSTLVDLRIEYSANITRTFFSGNEFGSLTNLSIYQCNNGLEFSSVEQMHSVHPGNKLGSLKISYLYIDHLCLLLIEPLQSLRYVKHLEVRDCSGMVALPEQWLLQNSSTLKRLIIQNASSLQSLPGKIKRLAALETIYISNAALLEKIPELPTSLIRKEIYGSGGRVL
jgi:NB-ARC domain/Rx N-terminal domain